jgi:ATP-dependent DNA helicase RecG
MTAQTSTPAQRLALTDDVQWVRGAGPTLAPLLAKLGLHTVYDLLRHAPRRYEDRTRFETIASARHGSPVVIMGRVLSAENVATSRRNFTVTKIVIDDGTGLAQLVFFQQPYLQRTFEKIMKGSGRVTAFGMAKRVGANFPIEMATPEWEDVDQSDGLSMNRIVPIYPGTEGLPQKRLRRIVENALEGAAPSLKETLPTEIIEGHRLWARERAFRNLHFPADWRSHEEAKRRLVFEEFFLAQTGLALRRIAAHVETGAPRIQTDRDALRDDLATCLPFELTGAQKRAVADIAGDLSSGQPMGRLLQGDVGSGKTAVALAGILMAVKAGYQVALMAPTEILAQQHERVLHEMLRPVDIRVDLAIGSLPQRKKDILHAALASGVSRVVVGTHALIQDAIEFQHLGLVIVDEQHRFGVLQREALRAKGLKPHMLVMTATPIPRTLVMTLYGDLDVSVLDELPPGRKPIKTHWKRSSERFGVYAGVKKLLREGRQAYIVCPLVEESEKLQAKAAKELAVQVSTELLPEFRIGLLHGQMKSAEKESVMIAFKAGEIDALVCTTVVEVGIDVPNACVMVVENAERFGLAQLHQLRGRVGRGEHPSFCVLIGDPKTEDGEGRLSAMVETTDGFKIAEEDLRLRGPGEYLGTRQSGLPDFRFGNLIEDRSIMEAAREAAQKLVASDPSLKLPQHQALRLALSQFGAVAERLQAT